MPTPADQQKKFKIEVEFETSEGLGGFRTEWLSAKGDGFEAGIDSGAGLGNGDLTFWIQRDGEKSRTYFRADVTKILTDAINHSPTFPFEDALKKG